MGREIRRVAPNWKHPKDAARNFIPMYDKSFREGVEDWKAGYASWERGERPDYCSEGSQSLEFWEWEGPPPDREMYRPDWTDEPTWFQVYETVSEGTPVTPPFPTEKELIDYLVTHGDFWCQSRPNENPPSHEAATAFVTQGWAPSMVIVSRIQP